MYDENAKKFTSLNDAASKVRLAVAEKKERLQLKALHALTWHEAFTLASIGEIVNPSHPGSTYTVERSVFDSAQATSFAFRFTPSVIRDCLRELRDAGLIEMRNPTEASVTPKGEKLLLRAAKQVK
jgi:hypothetical protein